VKSARRLGETSKRTDPFFFVVGRDSPLESSLSLECEEGRRFEARISVAFQFADAIQELMQLMLEHLKINVFSKRLEVVIGLGVTTKKAMEILDLSDEKDDERIGATQQLQKLRQR
jgi:hypothetical protein